MTQYGGGANPKKLWNKYETILKLRLLNDTTYNGYPIRELTALPEPFNRGNQYNKFMEWIIRSYLDGGIRYYVDIEQVYPALDRYMFLIREKKIPSKALNIGNICGLYGCKGMSGLLEILEPYKDIPIVKTKKHIPIFDGVKVKIYAPENEEEAQEIGRNTKWCTSAAEDCAFDEHRAVGSIYIIVPKKTKHIGEKYQMLLETDALKNEQDNTVNRASFFKEYPEVKDFITERFDGINLFRLDDILFKRHIRGMYDHLYTCYYGEQEIPVYLENQSTQLDGFMFHNAILERSIAQELVNSFQDIDFFYTDERLPLVTSTNAQLIAWFNNLDIFPSNEYSHIPFDHEALISIIITFVDCIRLKINTLHILQYLFKYIHTYNIGTLREFISIANQIKSFPRKIKPKLAAFLKGDTSACADLMQIM